LVNGNFVNWPYYFRFVYDVITISLEKLKLYGWHKEYGLLALWLVILRLGWRLGNAVPVLSLPLWERIAARGVHWRFMWLCLHCH